MLLSKNFLRSHRHDSRAFNKSRGKLIFSMLVFAGWLLSCASTYAHEAPWGNFVNKTSSELIVTGPDSKLHRITPDATVSFQTVFSDYLKKNLDSNDMEFTITGTGTGADQKNYCVPQTDGKITKTTSMDQEYYKNSAGNQVSWPCVDTSSNYVNFGDKDASGSSDDGKTCGGTNVGQNQFPTDLQQPFSNFQYHAKNDLPFSVGLKVGANDMHSGDITILSQNKCDFDLPVGHKSSAITANIGHSMAHPGQPYNFDLGTMFIDAAPNLEDPNHPPLQISSPIGLPKGVDFKADLKQHTYSLSATSFPKSSCSSVSSSYSLCPVKFCACDKNVNKAQLAPGEGGSCSTSGQPDCSAGPQGGTGPIDGAYVDKVSGSIASTLYLGVRNGVYPKTPLEIANSSATPLMVALKDTGSVGVGTDVSSLFLNNDKSTKYSIVEDSDSIPNRNNGNTPWPSNPSNSSDPGKDWGPVLINNGQPAQSITGAGLKINGANVVISPSDVNVTVKNSQEKLSDYIKNNGGAIIQLTVKASDSGHTAYQTLYFNLSKDNVNGHPNFTLLKPRVSAWAYAPTVSALTGSFDPKSGDPIKPSPDSKCFYTGTKHSFAPLDGYLTTIDDSVSMDSVPKAYPLSEITPDIGWIQFHGTSKQWQEGDTLSNNAVDTPYIGCFANYFKELSDVPDFKFIVTMEFDGNLKGYLPNLDLVDLANINETSQMQQLTQAVIDAANPKKVFPNANILADHPTESAVDGIQFDVEPLPTSGNALVFYKRVADLLAREGKINQIFAFANSDTPALIMSQGPLGIFLPSMYDVGQKTYADTAAYHEQASSTATAYWGSRANHQAYSHKVDAASGGVNSASGSFDYPASFAGAPSLNPTEGKGKAIDYGCHWSANLDSKRSSSFLAKSYCNIDNTNTDYNNALRMNKVGDQDDFQTTNLKYGGHYAVSVPAEGSATNWSYEIIYNPRLSNIAGGGCDTSKGDPCVGPFPNTYTPNYVGIVYDRSMDKGEITAIDTYYKSNGLPAYGTYDVFYHTSQPETNGNNVKAQCSMNPNETSKNTTMCDALVINHNDGSVDGDTVLKGDNGNWINMAPQTLKRVDPVETVHQVSNVKAIYDFSDHSGQDTDHLSLDTALPAPSSDNENYRNNVGVAMYALSSESISGCQPGGSHGDNANCIDAYPFSFPGKDDTTSGHDLWSKTETYMNSKPSVLPADITAAAHFISDAEEKFDISNLPAGKTCNLTVIDPNGESLGTTPIPASNLVDVTRLTDPSQYTSSNYQWNITCGDNAVNDSTTVSATGTFERYGDKFTLCLSGMGKSYCSSSMSESVPSTYNFSVLPVGKYSVTFSPQKLNRVHDTESNGYHDKLTDLKLESAGVNAADSNTLEVAPNVDLKESVTFSNEDSK